MAQSRSTTSVAFLVLWAGAHGPLLGAAATNDQSNAADARVAANVPALALVAVWRAEQSPRGFLVSEKYDGVRAFWDGQTLRFRSGRAIAAPAWFTAALPKTSLDGELWLGRGRFDELSGMVRRVTPQDSDWHQVQYMIFDLPQSTDPFSERVQRIQSIVAQAHQPWLQAVPYQRVVDSHGLQTLLTTTVQAGGEGLVLHRDSALWLPGRSDALFKLKLQPDEDARVVGHLPGKGRHSGRLGALLLEMPDGQRFALGTGFTDAQRDDPPAVGSLVTYRYREHTPKGLPRFASFLRPRAPE